MQKQKFTHGYLYFVLLEVSIVCRYNPLLNGCYNNNPKSVISVMMITTLVFEQMSLRFEGAMGFHCNRETERQMTKRKFVSA